MTRACDGALPPRSSLVLVLLLVAASLTGAACRDAPLPATGEQSTETFHSDIVGADYLLRIRLPPDYSVDASRIYPLVVQLDPTFVGLQQYDITVGLISDRAARGEWPEAIVVGVDYPNPYDRERDYTPPDPVDPAYGGDGADRFYRALAEEILPWIEGRYRVDPTRRYLLGHSNGGVFAWYAAFRHDPAVGPPLFAGLVAADNGYDESMFTYERWHAERATDLPLRIYTTRAAYNGASQQITFDAMMERVRGRGFPSLALRTEVLETDHGGAVWPSYERGLAFVLGGVP